MSHNRFQTADNQTGANHGRVANAPTDQRRFAALSTANGRAKTRPSRGTQSRDTAGGTVFHAPRVSRTEAANAICQLGDFLIDPADTAKKVIRPGYITGGSGAPILLEQNGIIPKAGESLYLEIPVTVDVVEGVLMHSFEMSGVDFQQGASVPDSHTFTPDEPTGVSIYVLGSWTEVPVEGGDPLLVWNRTGCGTIVSKICSSGATAQLLTIREGIY